MNAHSLIDSLVEILAILAISAVLSYFWLRWLLSVDRTRRREARWKEGYRRTQEDRSLQAQLRKQQGGETGPWQ